MAAVCADLTAAAAEEEEARVRVWARCSGLGGACSARARSVFSTRPTAAEEAVAVTTTMQPNGLACQPLRGASLSVLGYRICRVWGTSSVFELGVRY